MRASPFRPKPAKHSAGCWPDACSCYGQRPAVARMHNAQRRHPPNPVEPMTPPDAAVPPQTPDRLRGRSAWDRALKPTLALEGGGEGVPEAWFLGPRAENLAILQELIAAA